jgi:hypothetical protein
MKWILSILVFLFSLSLFPQTECINKINADYIKVITSKYYDNQYFILGEFSGELSINNTIYNSRNSSNDIFIASYSNVGDLLWFKTIGSNLLDIPSDMSIYNNEIYISLDFNDTIWFNQNSHLISTGLMDAVILKLDNNGNIIWYKQVVKGTTNQRTTSLTIKNDKIYLTGIYAQFAEFDGDTILGTTSTSDFIASFDLDGIFIWTKGFLGNYNITWFRDIDITNNGLVIIGQWRNELILNEDTLISNNNLDSYVWSIDEMGNTLWLRTFKGLEGDDHFNTVISSDKINISAVSKSSNINIQSNSTDYLDTNINNLGNFDMLLLSYDFNGNLLDFKKWGTIGNDRLVCIDYKNSNYLYTGFYTGQLSIDDTLYSNILTDGITVTYTNDIQKIDIISGNKNDFNRSVVFCDGGYIVSGDSDSDTLQIDDNIIYKTHTNIAYIYKYNTSILATLIKEDVLCNGDSNGMANIIINGLEPVYYLWSNGNTTNSILNLSVGQYYVTISNLFEDTIISVSIDEPNILNGTTQTTCSQKKNCTGSATVNVNGGTPPYTYQWSNGGNTQTISNICKDKYSVTVTDHNSCIEVFNNIRVQFCFNALESKSIEEYLQSGGELYDIAGRRILIINDIKPGIYFIVDYDEIMKIVVE